MRKKFKNLFVILILVVSILNIGLISADINSGCGMMYGMYGGFGSGMMLLSWLTYILFIILIVTAIYWLIKSANRRR